MDHVLSITLSATPVELLAATTIGVFSIIFISMGTAIRRLSETIKRKDFSFRPEYDKRSGELQWARPTQYYGW